LGFVYAILIFVSGMPKLKCCWDFVSILLVK